MQDTLSIYHDTLVFMLSFLDDLAAPEPLPHICQAVHDGIACCSGKVDTVYDRTMNEAPTWPSLSYWLRVECLVSAGMNLSGLLAVAGFEPRKSSRRASC